MGLLGTTTAEQYYNSSQRFTTTAAQASSGDFQLTVSNLPANEDAFIVYVNGTEVNQSTYTFPKATTTDTINFTSGLPILGDVVLIDFIDRSLGDYRYINLTDIVTNFMYGYTGNGKVLNNINKSEILFQAKRGIQEFAYDVARIEKIQEISVPPSLTIPMPQDYVHYVRLSWVDTAGVEHPIFPARYTSRPSESIAQDSDDNYLFDEDGGVLQMTPSVTEDRFTNEFVLDKFSGKSNKDDYYLFSHYIANNLQTSSSRIGLNPETTNYNGVFIIDEVNGQFGFDSSMADRIITLKYVSDGLAQDGEMRIHKFAEDAIYKYIYHAILSTTLNIPEFQIMRAKKERRAAMRNAKLRLSSIKLQELTQVMTGKAKIIKR
tara:strand:+ start:701 stop:1831 length:1131 start_codon:yes stop_codon:yes gene_type:complete